MQTIKRVVKVPADRELRIKLPDEATADEEVEVIVLFNTSPASVVRQTVDNLLSLARARFTFSKMSDALAVQMNGLGSAL